MKKIFTQSNNGFNLMELIIAGVILGVLAGLAMPRFNTVVERFRAKEGDTALRDVYGSQKRYFIENSSYYQNGADPDDLSGLDITAPILHAFDNLEPKNLANFYGFTVLATIDRTDNTYKLAIETDGQIVCACDDTSPICPKIGYTRYSTW